MPDLNVNDIFEREFPDEFLRHLGHDVEVVNYTRSVGSARRGRAGEPVRNDAESGIAPARIRVPNQPITSTTTEGQTVEYDAIVTLRTSDYPIYASDDPDAAYPTEILVSSANTGSAGTKRYRVLEVRDRRNSLLSASVREVNSSLVDERPVVTASTPESAEEN